MILKGKKMTDLLNKFTVYSGRNVCTLDKCMYTCKLIVQKTGFVILILLLPMSAKTSKADQTLK